MSFSRIHRSLEFDAGHRVLRHESKCAHLHGHRYKAVISVQSDHLDPLGRVIDYGVIKTLIGKWIDDNWDHNLLLHPDDPLLKAVRVFDGKARQEIRGFASAASTPYADSIFGGKAPYIFPACNPTAENIASVLFERAEFLLGEHAAKTTGPRLKLSRVRIYETPNCWADAFNGKVG